MNRAKKGDWVEIEQLILRPEERAPTLPEDTKATPLVMRVHGFLLDDAALGEFAKVRTIIGRELSGTLRALDTAYTHSFGATVPELLTIGTEAER